MADLSKLTKEQKIELLKALKLKELKKQESKIDSFVPNKPQEQFLSSQKKLRAMFAANAVGKTTALTIDLIYTCLDRHPERDTTKARTIWFLIPGFQKIEDYIREIKQWCPPSLFPQVDKMGSPHIRRLRWQNGKTVTFYSFDQDPAQLEGTNIDVLYSDECPPRKLWVAAFRGLRNNPDYFVAMAGTPISEPWLYTDVYLPGITGQNKDTEIITGTIYENPYLTKEFVDDFESRLTDDEKRVRLFGEFSALQGRVFKEFDRKVHVLQLQDFPNDWPVYFAIDPHSRKKSTAIWIGVTKDEELIVINETAGEDIEDLALKVNAIEKEHKYRVVKRLIDNSGVAKDWTGRSAIEILAKHGIRVSPVRQEEKAVHDGIICVKKLFKDKRLFMFENCIGTISDLSLYGWQENHNEDRQGQSEKVRKTNDDYVDLIRYIAMSKPCHRPSLGTSPGPTSHAYKRRS
jgi:hypothetical protein